MPFEQMVFEVINDIVTDLETIRESMNATDELLDADAGVTDTDYEANGSTYDGASTMLGFSLVTIEQGD